MSKTRKTTINFSIHLDENNVPEAIEWEASDNGQKGQSEAAFLTLWDKKEKNTLRIDLWTKDMMVEDMKIFFHQMLLSMSDTFKRSTGDEKLGEEIKAFAMQLGEKMKIIKKA